MTYEEKKKALLSYIDELATQNIALAFSGGVDSSLLLKICCNAAEKTGTKVYAVTIHTKLHPMKDLTISKQIAREAGAEHIVLQIDELEEAGIKDNPEDRCYRCKKCLFQKLKTKAQEVNAGAVMEGTNEDDLHVYRPGIRALRELEILSPLARFDITKAEVRKMAAEYGMEVAARPSTPCMATRFPYGDTLSYDIMRNIEEGEEWLRTKGFYNVRLRAHQNILRIEIDTGDFPEIIKIREDLLTKMNDSGFDYITLDLEGFRSGSMDIHVKNK